MSKIPAENLWMKQLKPGDTIYIFDSPYGRANGKTATVVSVGRRWLKLGAYFYDVDMTRACHTVYASEDAYAAHTALSKRNTKVREVLDGTRYAGFGMLNSEQLDRMEELLKEAFPEAWAKYPK